ncbi:hypothetical protein BASA81_009803 [Batrachochytrium salamandrivorans]|nr:hypothetical protein BASA81_009803 [Batrachochytrium salamandrivorans]
MNSHSTCSGRAGREAGQRRAQRAVRGALAREHAGQRHRQQLARGRRARGEQPVRAAPGGPGPRTCPGGGARPPPSEQVGGVGGLGHQVGGALGLQVGGALGLQPAPRERVAPCAQGRRSFRDDAAAAGSAYLAVSAALLAWTLVFFLASDLALLALRRLRPELAARTSWPRILLLDLACLCSLAVGPVRDLVGYEVFVCDWELWARTAQIFCLLAGFNLEIALLRSKVALARLLDQAHFSTLQDFARTGRDARGWHARLSRKSVAPADAEDPDREHKLQRLRRAFWTSSLAYQLAKGSVTSLLPMLVCCVALQLASPFYGHGCVNCLLVEYHYLVILLFGALPFGALVSGMARLRGEPDPFRSVHNILRDSAVLLPFVAAGLPLYCANPGRIIDRAVFSPDWLMIAGYHLVHCLLVPYEVYLAATQPRARCSRQELEALLQDAGGLQLFTAHLQREFNAENVALPHARQGLPRALPQLRLARAGPRRGRQHLLDLLPPQRGARGQPARRGARRAAGRAGPARPAPLPRGRARDLRAQQRDAFPRFASTPEYRDWSRASRFVGLSAASSSPMLPPSSPAPGPAPRQ